MKINYRILWVDDHLKGLEPFIINLENKLENLGFKLKVDKKVTLTGTDLTHLRDRLETYNPYDIIIFDYDLGDTKGDDIAHKLRTTIYTDMIFYSGTKGAELREILFKKKIDGVYIVDRSDFIDEVWPIIEDQIKRICDINNMRGVILDEMSKIDLGMRNLYKIKFEQLTEDKKKEQLKKFIGKLTERKRAIEKQVDKINTEDFSKIITTPTKVEFNIVRSRLKTIINNEIFNENGKLKSNQDLRNKFAHSTAEFNNDEGTISLAGDTETYSFKDFTKIRKELIELDDNIKNLY